MRPTIVRGPTLSICSAARSRVWLRPPLMKRAPKSCGLTEIETTWTASARWRSSKPSPTELIEKQKLPYPLRRARDSNPQALSGNGFQDRPLAS